MYLVSCEYEFNRENLEMLDNENTKLIRGFGKLASFNKKLIYYLGEFSKQYCK